MTGRSLGTPQSQFTKRLAKDQLSIDVDGRVFSGETKVAKYTNAMELATVTRSGWRRQVMQVGRRRRVATADDMGR